MAFATVTSQGQVTIPAKIRKQLNIKTSSKVLIDVKDNKIIIEQAPDILDLAGSLNHKAIKGVPIDDIIKMEEKAVEEAIVERYIKKKKK